MSRRRNVDFDNNKDKKKISREEFKEALKIFRFVKPYKWYLVGAFLMLSLSSLVTMVFPYLAGVIADIAAGTSDTDLNDVGVFLIIILLVQGVISFSQVWLNAVVSEKSMADLRMSLYKKMISLPIFFYEKNRVGELMSRISSDVAKLQSVFSYTLLNFFRQVFVLIIGIVLLLILTPQLSLVMLATFPVVVIGALFFGRYLRKLSKNRQQELANTNIIVEESLLNIKSVKSFTNEEFESDRYNSKIRSLVGISLSLARVRGGFSTFIVVLIFGGLFFVLWMGATFVIKPDNDMTIGDLVTFIAYTGFIGGAIAGLGNFYSEIVAAIGGTERIREILKLDSELDIHSEERLDVNGDITYEDVHFAYPSRPEFAVLKGISFDLKAGSKTALVGQSGAGKSTIVQLLLRFYELNSGRILVDGKEIEQTDYVAFRQNIANVPQEILLFGGTLTENIRYGRPGASEEEILDAAKKANCYNFIMDFPDQFETQVGEMGVQLSGGQKQRVAIARAILKDPKILILDEATSALDSENERLVQEALENLMENRTSIIIAHRLSTIRNVDNILVMDDGEIIEQGNHDELMNKENSIYSNLVKLQYE